MPVADTNNRQMSPALQTARRYPLTQPNAPKLSAYVSDVVAIEDSHWLTNYGPTNTKLERAIVDQVFDGGGTCLTVCNATLGLMIALKHAADTRSHVGARFVIMPSMTFAAAAHAVLWAGLVPLLVDIDPDDWAASQRHEVRVLKKYGNRIAAIMPYATFGTCIDLTHYDRLSEYYDVPVVVDAAASLGSVGADGKAFGYGSRHSIVFSMHATKAFGVGECGLIYSADQDKIESFRRMGNFGFDGARAAVMAGLNSKISEVVALTALIKLSDYKAQILHRSDLAQLYVSELPGWTPQRTRGSLVAYQFMPLRLPKKLHASRQAVCARLSEEGIGTGQYFSPHIAQQPYFKTRCVASNLDVTETVAASLVSLPISDFLTVDDVLQICAVVRRVEDEFSTLPIANLVTGAACSQIATAP